MASYSTDFTDILKQSGIKEYGAGRWPQWRTWHIGAPAVSNFSYGNYDYVAPDDRSREKTKGTGTGSNVNRALYRFATLKGQNQNLSDADAWNQAVEWVIKHNVGKLGTGFVKRASSTPGTPAPGTPGAPSQPAPAPRAPVGPPPSSPTTPPSGGTPPVSVPYNPGVPGGMSPVGPGTQYTPSPTTGLPWSPADEQASNFLPALRHAFGQQGWGAGPSNTWFKWAQDRIPAIAQFYNTYQNPQGGSNQLGIASQWAQQMLRQGGSNPLDYNTFAQMVGQLGQSDSPLQQAVLGGRDATSGEYLKTAEQQMQDIMRLVGGGAGLAMNPLMARSLSDSLRYLYDEYEGRSSGSQSNLLEFLSSRSPALRQLLGR